jgi:hypothetical protein
MSLLRVAYSCTNVTLGQFSLGRSCIKVIQGCSSMCSDNVFASYCCTSVFQQFPRLSLLRVLQQCPRLLFLRKSVQTVGISCSHCCSKMTPVVQVACSRMKTRQADRQTHRHGRVCKVFLSRANTCRRLTMDSEKLGSAV